MWPLERRGLINLTLITLLILISSYIFSVAQVEGNSMKPTLKENEIIVYYDNHKYLSSFMVGDIILIRRDNKVLIKRIHSIKKEGYEVYGDNLKESVDSRNFGLIERSKIEGTYLFKITDMGIIITFIIGGLIIKWKH